MKSIILLVMMSIFVASVYRLKVAIEFCPMLWLTDKASVICVVVPRVMPHQNGIVMVAAFPRRLMDWCKQPQEINDNLASQ